MSQKIDCGRAIVRVTRHASELMNDKIPLEEGGEQSRDSVNHEHLISITCPFTSTSTG